MLGILILFFIGRIFYRLAERYGRNVWGYGALGIVLFYLSMTLSGALSAIAYDLFGFGSIDEMSDNMIFILSFPLGLLIYYGFYKFTEKKFKDKGAFLNHDEILDEGMTLD